MSAAHIRRCIAGCVRALDGRGIWHNQNALQQRLLAEGSTPTIARATAEAAVSVAQVIRQASAKAARSVS
jgi:hypothetical protein